MNAFHAGRIVATAILLWFTWHQTTWAVALPITLMAINGEATALVLRRYAEALKLVLELKA
jgi:hypothetical protein